MAQSPAQQVADLHALLDSMSLDAYDEMAGPECAALATSLMRATARVKAHELAAVRSVEKSDEARRQGATSTTCLSARLPPPHCPPAPASAPAKPDASPAPTASCPAHHRILHIDGWDIQFTPDGIPEYLPPPRLDPERTPRRHTRFTLAA